jgi:hypothetical protein
VCLCEPVETYRVYSKQAYSFIQITALLNEGKEAERGLWLAARGRPPWGTPSDDGDVLLPWEKLRKSSKRPVESMMRQYLLTLLNTHWLAHLSLYPQLEWGSGKAPKLVFYSGVQTLLYDETKREERDALEQWDRVRRLSREEDERLLGSHWRQRPSKLFAKLALSLAAVVTNPTTLYICDICGTVFENKRKLRVDSARLCSREECKVKRHRQILKQSYRRRREKEAAVSDGMHNA